MRFSIVASVSVLLLPLASIADDTQRLYRWVDDQGHVHYGDLVPAEYADAEKHVLNTRGITIDIMAGKKTAEQIAEDSRIAELRREQQLARRALAEIFL